MCGFMVEGKQVQTKENIIKSTLKYSISNIVLRISQIIQGIFVANILGPAAFGLKNAIQLISDYGQYIHLGAQNTFYKERQKYEYSDVKYRDYITNVTISFFIIVSIIFFLLSIIAYFLLPYSQVIKTSILVIGLLVPVSLFNGFFTIMLQAKSDFGTQSRYNLLQAIFVLMFVVIAVYLFGVVGYFVGALIGFLVVGIYLYYKLALKYNFVFDLHITWLFLKKGFLLFILNLNYLVFFSIDRLFIIYFYGETPLGYYAIGLFFANLMYFFMVTLLLPVVPQIYQNLDSKKIVSKYIIKPYIVSIKLIYYLVFIILFFFPFVIFILPAYSAGFTYINILVFSVMFFPILIFNYFIGKNREVFLLIISIFFVFLILILDLIVCLCHLSPIYIAVATLITFFFYGNVLNIIGYKEILGSWRSAFKAVFNYLWPLGYALLGYGLLWLLAHYWLYGIMNYYLAKIVQAFLFTIWYSPILWKIEKEHRILRIIVQALRKKFGKSESVYPKNIE